jgi:RNA polymerase sigma factor (sigma-70 family)
MSEPLQISDNELWQLLRQGEQRALETIYNTHVKALQRYGSRFSLDESQVSDCLHDLFVYVWQKREDLTPDIKSIRFYLIKSLRNRIVRRLERDQKISYSDAISDDSLGFELSHDMFMIENEESDQRNAQLNQALETLSTRQREALFLRFYQDLSYEEVAHILGVEQQSAYNLIFRAVEALRQRIKPILIWLFLAYSNL